MRRLAATLLLCMCMLPGLLSAAGGGGTPAAGGIVPPDSLRSLYLYTDALKRLLIDRDTAGARTLCHEALRCDSACAPASYTLAANGMYDSNDEAVALAGRAYRSDTTNKWYGRLYGQTLIYAERYGDALDIFRRLLRDDPREPDNYRLVAALYEQVERPYSALATLDSAEVRFDTVMDWQDNHRFLKTAFDTSVRQEFARFDVQFGNVKRPTTRNNSVEKAKFEVLNHKYTDLSETRFGVAVLNDSKYGISVNGGKLRLSLHKGGLRPDFKGDRGVHHCVYSFLPHDSGFDAESVIRPAYELNVPAAVTAGEYSAQKLMSIDADNIFVEAVKPCEDAQRAFIVRMYEAEGTFTNAKVSFFDGAKSVKITNMLEEEQGEVENIAPAKLQFRPFEIKTLKVTY